MKSVYNERDTLSEKIPSFWKIVLSQHLDFANYIRASDFKYIDAIEKVTVDYDSDIEKIGNFNITFHFNEVKDDMPKQIVTKGFQLVKIIPDHQKNDDNDNDNEDEDEIEPEETLISEVVDIIWPKQYDSINPSLIKGKKSAEEKKNYRQGMKSFFGWFKWTGLKPGKEFPHGDSFATLFSEDLYPFCVKYYTEAQRDLEDEASNSEDSDEEGINLEEEGINLEDEGGEMDDDSEPPNKRVRI